jgi:ATP-dependent Clp protease ATP-binding subunit ClpA
VEPVFERYTEKARRVIFFARYEASQFGSSLIESEHLLLGILREDKEIADQFLRSATAVESIRVQIESRTVSRKKVSTSVDLPLSYECKRILEYGAEEGERLGHKHIGTGHLFLGILREEKCFAADILHERGLGVTQVRKWVAEPSSPPSPPSPEIGLDAQGRWTGPRGVDLERYSLKAARAILLAGREADQLASSAIEAEHLLLGVLREDKAISKQLLHSETAAESIRKQIESNDKRPKREPNTAQRQMADLRKLIRDLRQRMESAIANHQFEKARFLSGQERLERDRLYELAGKHGVDAFPAVESSPSGLPLSEQCERVLSLGAEEATLLKQRYIGTEHLLLGILREEKSFAADILHESGLQLAPAREEIARWNQEQGGDHV